MDYLVRAVTEDGAIRIFATDTTELAEEAHRLHRTAATATAALGRLLTAAAMMGAMLKSERDSITLQINGGGPLGKLIAVADSSCNVKGYVDNPYVDISKDGKLGVGAAVGRDGMLSVIRDFGLKEPYVGQVPLVSGEIAEDITSYFAVSEQIPSVVALGVLVDVDLSVKSAGGFIIQLMPEATECHIAKIEEAIKEVSAVSQILNSGMTPESIIEKLLEGFKIEYLDKVYPKFLCNCSREKMRNALISLGKKEIEDILKEQGHAEIVCHFCNKRYNFGKEELEGIIEKIDISKKTRDKRRY